MDIQRKKRNLGGKRNRGQSGGKGSANITRGRYLIVSEYGKRRKGQAVKRREEEVSFIQKEKKSKKTDADRRKEPKGRREVTPAMRRKEDLVSGRRGRGNLHKKERKLFRRAKGRDLSGGWEREKKGGVPFPGKKSRSLSTQKKGVLATAVGNPRKAGKPTFQLKKKISPQARRS